MAGQYSGNLVKTYAVPGDQRALTPDKRHTARDHGADGTDQYPGTHQVPASQGAMFAGTAFPDDVTRGGGIVLGRNDRAGVSSPAGQGGTHGSRAVRRSVNRYNDVGETSGLAVTADGHDEGGERSEVADKWAGYPVQDSTTVYDADVYNAQEITQNDQNQGGRRLLAGINGNPVNNPDRVGYTAGVRPGLFRWMHVDRDRMLHRRRYDYAVQPQIQRGPITTPVNRPPANPTGFGGPSLADWTPEWTRMKDKIPGIWRDPGAVDASIIAGQPTSSYGTVVDTGGF